MRKPPGPTRATRASEPGSAAHREPGPARTVRVAPLAAIKVALRASVRPSRRGSAILDAMALVLGGVGVPPAWRRRSPTCLLLRAGLGGALCLEERCVLLGMRPCSGPLDNGSCQFTPANLEGGFPTRPDNAGFQLGVPLLAITLFCPSRCAVSASPGHQPLVALAPVRAAGSSLPTRIHRATPASSQTRRCVATGSLAQAIWALSAGDAIYPAGLSCRSASPVSYGRQQRECPCRR